MGSNIKLFIILSFLSFLSFLSLLSANVCASPSNTVSVPNTFTAQTTISSSQTNANNNEIQSKYNSHTHTDITQVATITSGVWNGTAVSTQYGGTGQDLSAVSSGSILYLSNTGVISTLAQGATGQLLQTAFGGVPPVWVTPTPATTLGSWDATKLDTTIYQASTDGFVCALLTTGDGIVAGFTDSATPPTTLRGKINRSAAGGADNASITFPVKKNDYWEVTGSSARYFIPLGT